MRLRLAVSAVSPSLNNNETCKPIQFNFLSCVVSSLIVFPTSLYNNSLITQWLLDNSQMRDTMFSGCLVNHPELQKSLDGLVEGASGDFWIQQLL